MSINFGIQSTFKYKIQFMKKNIFFLVSVVLFVCLFYKQEPGINIAIFGITSWVFLLNVTRPKNRTREFWLLSAASIVSALSFAWYGDFLSFVALFISLLLTGFKAYYPRLNAVAAPLNIAFNYVSFIFRLLTPDKWLGFSLSSDGLAKKLVSYFLIPAVLTAMFIGVYTAASDKFASFFNIDFNADFVQIFVLTALGFFLMFNFFHTVVPKQLIVLNRHLNDEFGAGFVSKKAKGFHLLDIVSQRRSGEISLVLLNVVLCLFITTYCVEQFGSKAISGTLSNEVHERVYVLILSIVMAIIVIMIYFQGLLNFDAKSNLLKKLTYIWIGLNVVLIATVIFRNLEYVDAYGLTFKRIGVFIFLSMSLLGLLFTAYKIGNKKTNIFLINRMAWSFFSLLVISSVINWSWMVTRFNTSHLQNPDWSYLNSLDYNKKLLSELYTANGMDRKPIIESLKYKRPSKILSRVLYYESINITK